MNTFSERPNAVSRRHVIEMLGLGAMLPLAGCLGDDDDDDGELPVLGDILEWEDGYVMVHGGGPVTGSASVHREDFHSTLEFGDGTSIETYRIGSDLYLISDGECVRTTDQAGGGLLDPEEIRQDHRDVRASERTRIDDVDVYVFEIETGRFYVAVETGYPVLLEDHDSGVTLAFHSWGEIDPISPPDLDCTEG